MALDPDRRGALLAAKTRALVADHVGGDLGDSGATPFPGGAAMVLGADAWVLLDEHPATSLGRALAWGDQQGCDRTHVLVDDHDAAAVVARRAGHFTGAVEVWEVHGRSLRPAVAAAVPAVVDPRPEALVLAADLVDAGADVVVEHGVVLGEIEGLEVARVVEDDDGRCRLEVGVGRNDREAFAMVHGEVPTAEALAHVVATVASHRRADQPAHPLNRLAPERWLRRRLVDDPALVGATHLDVVEGTVARRSAQDRAAAMAVGARPDGSPLVVAASVGIDLDLVPAAADARAVHRPDAELVIVVPPRDDHAVTLRLAAWLRQPATVVPVGTSVP